MTDKAFSAWYQENGDALNKARRNRYHTDPEYRRQVIARQQAYRDRNRKPAAGKWTRGKAKSASRERHLKPRLFQVGGQEVLCSSFGALLERVRVAAVTLLDWEKKALVPPPTHVDELGRRWYSDAYVEAVSSAVADGRRHDWSNERLKEVVWERYRQAALGGK